MLGEAHAQKIRVVPHDIEPFSFDRDARRTGFAMELWDAVARELKLEYDTTPSAARRKWWPRSSLTGIGEARGWTLSIFLIGGVDTKGRSAWAMASRIALR